jgi:hypothetical protein
MLYIPTRSDIEAMQVGDKAMNCFGRPARVVEVSFRGTDIKGKAYVGVKLNFGPNSTITQSFKEDELVRHVGTSAKFTSHQLDDIEAEMLAKGERVREL